MASRRGTRRGSIRGSPLDVQKLATALSMPGIDPRTWVAAGTVGVREADGTFTTRPTEAIFADELGPVVMVRIEPQDVIVSARYSGMAVGRFGSILVPLRGGDEVTLTIEGGDLNTPQLMVSGFHSNQLAKIPTDWNNDRVLFDLNVPFEVRAPAIRMTSPSLVLNGRSVRSSGENL